MSNTRTIRLEFWEMDFAGDFDLGGKASIFIRGATNDGQGQQHEIRLKLDEMDLAYFASNIRDRFRRLKALRSEQDHRNLKDFKEASDE